MGVVSLAVLDFAVLQALGVRQSRRLRRPHP